MISEHIDKLRNAMPNDSIELYNNYNKQRKNPIDCAIVNEIIVENIRESIENAIKKSL